MSKDFINSLQTGDLILFDSVGQGWFMDTFNWIVKTTTHSKYTHCAIVLRDPFFIDPSLKGIFIWESGWEGTPDPQDGEKKLGVQITSIYECLHNFTGKVWVRKLHSGQNLFTYTALSHIHETVYKKPYDIHLMDWLGAAIRWDAHPQKKDRFWCSAFVAYVLVQIGALDDDMDWSLVRPCDLSSSSTYLTFKPYFRYGKEINA